MSEPKYYTLLQLEAMIDVIKDEFEYYERKISKYISIKLDLKADAYSIKLSFPYINERGITGRGPDDTDHSYAELYEEIKLPRSFKSGTLRDQLFEELKSIHEQMDKIGEYNL